MSGASVALIVLTVGFGLCFVLSILAAIAIPNFIRFQTRSKQSEAKANLKSVLTAQQALFASRSEYSLKFRELGFVPERGNYYLYALSAEGELLEPGQTLGEHSGILADSQRFPTIDNTALEKGVSQALWDQAGVRGTCPDACSVTIVAAGNIDGDDTIDVWSISSADRTIDGASVPAGTPFNHVNDVRD
jgi:type IV pilus assembly protein PilA